MAKTRAELAAKGEEVADEELEAIALGAKAQKKTTEPPNAEEKAAKGVGNPSLESGNLTIVQIDLCKGRQERVERR